jgi:CheY-like chemotaxis protein
MPSTDSGVRAKKQVVLFVEDNTELRELYAEAMREAGFLVAEVSTLGEALDTAPRLRPDLVVLDRMLPDGDGWDAARSFKSSSSTKAAPIVAFTANRGRADVERALVAGCDAFLEKPCSAEQLVRFALGLLGLPLPEDVAPPLAERCG